MGGRAPPHGAAAGGDGAANAAGEGVGGWEVGSGDPAELYFSPLVTCYFPLLHIIYNSYMDLYILYSNCCVPVDFIVYLTCIIVTKRTFVHVYVYTRTNSINTVLLLISTDASGFEYRREEVEDSYNVSDLFNTLIR